MRKIATRDAYGKALVRLGTENQNVVVLDADLSKSTKTADFQKHYPERFFNMGIAEQNLLGTAAGLATCGKTPFCSSFAVFATGRAFEQIRNSIAYPQLNVKIAVTHAGITAGEDGGSHQSVEDIAIMRSLPNMTIFVPADAVAAESAIYAAAAIKGPVYIRLGRSAVPTIYPEGYTFTPGKAEVLRKGKDATIIATGIMVAIALDATESLWAEGLEIGVIDMATIKPFDAGTVIDAAKNTGAIVTAEEGTVLGGLGSAVAETTAKNLPVPLEMIGLKDVFGQSGTPEELLAHYGLTVEGIVQAVHRVLGRKA